MTGNKFKLDRSKDTDHIYHLHEYGVDVQRNHIYLTANERLLIGAYGGHDIDEPGVEYTMATRFIINAQLCQAANPCTPLLIHLKTNGGSWEEGMAIYDTIRSHPTTVTILNYTHARSMSSMIFLAGDRRVMMPNSCFMFHQGTVDFSGTVKQFETEYDWSKPAKRKMLEIYADAVTQGPGPMAAWSRSRIINWLKSQMDRREEVYLTAESAVEIGFAHEIFDGNWDRLI